MKYLLIILLLCGCYSERKAKNQFSKAAIAYPKLPAEFCANEFPVKDSTIRDTLLTTDTLYIEGQDSVSVVTVNDTVRITIIKTLPAKIITKTVHIRDTIFQTNTAALKSCEIDKSSLIAITTKQSADIDKWHGLAKKRFWWIFALIGAISMYTVVKIYNAFKPGIKV